VDMLFNKGVCEAITDTLEALEPQDQRSTVSERRPLDTSRPPTTPGTRHMGHQNGPVRTGTTTHQKPHKNKDPCKRDEAEMDEDYGDMPDLTENDTSDSDDDTNVDNPNNAQATLPLPMSPATTSDGSAISQPQDCAVPKCQRGRTRARNARTMDSDIDSDEQQDDPVHASRKRGPSSETNERDALAQSAIERKIRLWDISHVVQIMKDWNALKKPDEPDDPVLINNWTGSCFDAAPLKEGHTRFAHINTRTLGVTSARGSRDEQENMWKLFERLQVGTAMLTDTGLLDSTPEDPMSSLRKSATIAKFAWKQRQSILTHAQGCPGTMRPAVGGTLLATNDAISGMLGVQLKDNRG
jgi:hypothetical protein